MLAIKKCARRIHLPVVANIKKKKKKLEDFIGAELDLDSDDSDNSE